MRAFSTVLATSLTGLILALGAGCGQSPQDSGGAPMPAVDEDSPEFAAMAYRQGLMQVIAFKAGTLRDMAEGNTEVDSDVFTEYAEDLAAVAGMVVDGFIPGSDVDSLPGSAALPELWANWDDFLERAETLEDVAHDVAELAEEGGFAAGQTVAAEEIGPACGGCHRNYRQRDD